MMLLNKFVSQSPKLVEHIRDNLILIILLIVALVITINIIDTSRKNNRLQQQQLEKQLTIATLDLQTKKQTLTNKFLKTDYYLDLAIREQKGYVLEDETVLLIKPQKIDQLKSAYQPPASTEKPPLSSLPNPRQWQHFFFPFTVND